MRWSRIWMVLCLCGAILCAGAARADDPAPPHRPKLVVVLVVDQMRNDYIEMYGAQWTQGFRRLLKNGARFRNAAYPYFNTVTCAGHATIGTGTFPSTHGMVLNAWWDRQAKKQVSCTDDPHISLLSYGPPVNHGNSPNKLLAPTLAGELRAQRGPASRIVSLSLKARSALMLAGQQADAVTWFETETGSWVTSMVYTQTPVPFLEKFFRMHPVERDFKRVWDRRLSARSYQFEDNGKGDKPPEYWSPLFPHPLRDRQRSPRPDADFYSAWCASPYSDAYLARMAAAAVEELGLGKGSSTDFLAVSFSALDLVGHSFGPRSHEVQDLLGRLDITIGALLAELDRMVGTGNYVLALSADHGVAAIPEQLQREGADAGRVVTNEIAQRVEHALTERWGSGKYVTRLLYTDLYFAPGIYQRLLADPPAMDAVLTAIRSVRGILQVFRSEELGDRSADGDPMRRSVALSYHPDRSGDLILIPRENWFFVNASPVNPPGPATTHGTGYPYDARVPVILMGMGIRRGEYSGSASPADIAPTLASLAGISLPKAEGRVLAEALSAPPAKP